VVINADGRAYADTIAPALSAIRRATRDVRFGEERRVIELAVLPSFGMRWLAPRLPRLSEAYPDIVVNLTARSDEFDFSHEPFDAAIHFGRPEWPDATLDLLFREAIVPVVGASAAARVRKPADLAALPLFVLRSRPDEWREWFALAGLDVDPGAPAGSFSQFLMMAQAVSAGAGAGMLPRFLIEPELASGALVAPFDIPLERSDAYFLARPDRPSSPALTAFAAWLLNEVERQPSEGAG
jgi:DNA-binding transcriptional LysR family regulator